MRTKGSGWGGGPLLYQKCPKCGKKKVYYDPIDGLSADFKCTACKDRFTDDKLVKQTFAK